MRMMIITISLLSQVIEDKTSEEESSSGIHASC
jgi:hypothetical protein